MLGRIARTGEAIWHPRFLELTRHYGYDPFLCRPADPDRKGTVENGFGFLERDFVRGSAFTSFEDMNARVRIWPDEVANKRVHGTTRQVPDEAWLVERDLLIKLPGSAFPAFDEEFRDTGPDATVWIAGTPYTVPWQLANRTVTVRLYHRHFEVLGLDGHIALRRSHVSEQDKGKLRIDKRHYEGMPRRPDAHGPGTAQRLEDALLMRFPGIAELLAGIKRRMKSLAHIHLRTLRRLADRYGDEAFLQAAMIAQGHRAHSAHSLRRLLERNHPIPPDEPVASLHKHAAFQALDERRLGLSG